MQFNVVIILFNVDLTQFNTILTFFVTKNAFGWVFSFSASWHKLWKKKDEKNSYYQNYV